MGVIKRRGFDVEGGQFSLSLEEGDENPARGLRPLGRNLKLAVVVPEWLKFSHKKVLDPESEFLKFWNRMFLACCFIAVTCDPFLFYSPFIDDRNNCLDIETDVALAVTLLRTLLDAFYCVRISFQLRTAFVPPSSQIFGRGTLITDPKQTAQHYITGGFSLDLISILPLPQIVIGQYLRNGRGVQEIKMSLLLIVLIQYIPRFVRIYPLLSELKSAAGVFVRSTFFVAIFYLILYLFLSHIVGAFWYILALQRNIGCWEKACHAAPHICNIPYLYCSNDKKDTPFPISWKNSSASFLKTACSVETDKIKFGIYEQALESGIFSENKFASKFSYCLWWGLQNLSTLGQGLDPSMSPGETLISVTLALFGFIFYALLIGNVQIVLQSQNLRTDAVRERWRHTEQWMQHHAVPEELRERMRRYDQYRWIQTRGVDENNVVQNMPRHLRRDAKRYICSDYLKSILFFANMSDRVLDAICERLIQRLYTENTYILRERDPVNELLFIVRGRLASNTTDGGRSGFYNASVLNKGDFCGDELLTWSLDPKTRTTLPLSTRTVQTLTDVEAYAITSDDMRYVADQFRCLHSRQFQNTFRYYSLQWRTWAARFIQSAWRRFLIQKMIQIHCRGEDIVFSEPSASSSNLKATIYASRFVIIALRGIIHRLNSTMSNTEWTPMSKPSEPDFDDDDTV